MLPRMELPPCGIYRTTRAVAGVPADCLVYFHNHGDPGPGVYLPASWKNNRASFEERGHTLAEPTEASALEPLAPEGFYRVAEAFHCCERQCKRFDADDLVQLGYDAAAAPILFVPELVDGVLGVPDRGTRVDVGRIGRLRVLRVPSSGARDRVVH
jgi:hypothetical protein